MTIQDESNALATFSSLLEEHKRGRGIGLREDQEGRWITYIKYPLKKDCNSPSVVAYARLPM